MTDENLVKELEQPDKGLWIGSLIFNLYEPQRCYLA